MSYKQIAKLIPLGMSAKLAEENLKDLDKKKPKLVKTGIKNIVGLSLIGATYSLISDL